MEHPVGMLAWLRMGDGIVMIDRAGEHRQRARAEGARIVQEPENMFWGDRRYEALDLEGHRWHFSERLPAAPPAPGKS